MIRLGWQGAYRYFALRSEMEPQSAITLSFKGNGNPFALCE